MGAKISNDFMIFRNFNEGVEKLISMKDEIFDRLHCPTASTQYFFLLHISSFLSHIAIFKKENTIAMKKKTETLL